MDKSNYVLAQIEEHDSDDYNGMCCNEEEFLEDYEFEETQPCHACFGTGLDRELDSDCLTCWGDGVL
jgi:hypothetical protein